MAVNVSAKISVSEVPVRHLPRMTIALMNNSAGNGAKSSGGRNLLDKLALLMIEVAARK
ncbi:hypothetical protein [Hymenobacter wooponensis]|uniref:hypothetical protein n=1 Tax=Hymenobacter wooponensis TaxID=1525360 RepID=UPI001AEC6E8F|nr:hypothetical protein [Hymenobacter wooponensis]